MCAWLSILCHSTICVKDVLHRVCTPGNCVLNHRHAFRQWTFHKLCCFVLFFLLLHRSFIVELNSVPNSIYISFSLHVTVMPGTLLSSNLMKNIWTICATFDYGRLLDQSFMDIVTEMGSDENIIKFHLGLVIPFIGETRIFAINRDDWKLPFGAMLLTYIVTACAFSDASHVALGRLWSLVAYWHFACLSR